MRVLFILILLSFVYNSSSQKKLNDKIVVTEYNIDEIFENFICIDSFKNNQDEGMLIVFFILCNENGDVYSCAIQRAQNLNSNRIHQINDKIIFNLNFINSDSFLYHQEECNKTGFCFDMIYLDKIARQKSDSK